LSVGNRRTFSRKGITLSSNKKAGVIAPASFLSTYRYAIVKRLDMPGRSRPTSPNRGYTAAASPVCLGCENSQEPAVDRQVTGPDRQPPDNWRVQYRTAMDRRERPDESGRWRQGVPLSVPFEEKPCESAPPSWKTKRDCYRRSPSSRRSPLVHISPTTARMLHRAVRVRNG
jgi:hypothetical protein